MLIPRRILPAFAAADRRPGARRRPSPAAQIALAAGVLATLAMPPLRGTGWVFVPALALLFGALRTAPSPARVGWWFGVAHQATLLHWLFLLGPDATISSRWLIPAAAIAAILYAALYYLLFGWLAGIVRRRLGGTAMLLLLPPLWTAMETLRTVGELGFPWCLSGAAWLQTPLYPLAASAGELGLGAVTALTAAALAAIAGSAGVPATTATGRFRRPRGAALVLAVVAAAAWLALGLGARGSPAAGRAPALRVAAVQADVSLHDKWFDATAATTTEPYTELTAEAARGGAELVVWAETAIPAYLLQDRRLLAWVRAVADSNDVYLYTGFPDARPGAHNRPERTNGSGLFDPDGQLIDRYAKHHLLPFGERMPFQRWLPWLGRLDLGQAEWNAGLPPQPMTVAPGGPRSLRIAGLICYESIFPSLARQAARDGAQALVNITNDGWFGKTAGPVQHAEMARLRAAETGLPVVRCANNGVSFITDGRGAVRARAGLGGQAVVAADVAPGDASTPFVRHGHAPLAFALAAWTLAVLGASLRARRREPA
ncbi:MAG: apolipoprotein N-acyltransferase [bacterium]|nr:apolipoprotein N-acyltransferase [bacterium]